MHHVNTQIHVRCGDNVPTTVWHVNGLGLKLYVSAVRFTHKPAV